MNISRIYQTGFPDDQDERLKEERLVFSNAIAVALLKDPNAATKLPLAQSCWPACLQIGVLISVLTDPPPLSIS
jgi:hypothetical protein